MKKAALAAAALGAVTISALAAAVVGSGPSAGTASSHREAPLISEDPSADSSERETSATSASSERWARSRLRTVTG